MRLYYTIESIESNQGSKELLIYFAPEKKFCERDAREPIPRDFVATLPSSSFLHTLLPFIIVLCITHYLIIPSLSPLLFFSTLSPLISLILFYWLYQAMVCDRSLCLHRGLTCYLIYYLISTLQIITVLLYRLSSTYFLLIQITLLLRLILLIRIRLLVLLSLFVLLTS